MALKTRSSFFNVATGVNTKRLYPTASLVSRVTGMPIPRNKAVVGKNAFSHEAGIHQHGMLRHHSTYEILRPEDVGLTGSELVLGKHSGRHAFRERVKALCLDLDERDFDSVFEDFKSFADKKKRIADKDIVALVRRAKESSGPHHSGAAVDETGTATGARSKGPVSTLNTTPAEP